MKPVTDPSILAQLDGTPQRKAVSDPALLAQLEGTEGGMLSDIPKEIAGAFNENLDAVKGMFGGTAEHGPVQQTLNVGKGLLGIPGMIASPVTGAARSILGHGLANAIHAAGKVIAPELAAKDNPQQTYEEAKGNVDTAMMAAAPRGASPKGLRTVSPEAPTAAQLKNAAKAVYNDPQIKSIPINPQDVANLSASIETDLLNQGFRPSHGNAPGTFAEVIRMRPGQGVQTVGVDDLRAARRSLGITEKQRDHINQPTPDANAARQAREKIDAYLDTLAPELKEANANYAAGKRADLLDYRMMKAEHRANRTGSGSNIENTMRQEVDKIGNRGLSKSEIAARDKIVEGTAGRNALRKVGKLGVSDGLSLLLHAGAATGTGGATVPIAAAGTVARKIGEMLTRRQVAQLSKSIRSRSPLAKALMASPQYAKIPKGAKAIAAALLSQNAQHPVLSSMMPSYADQDQR